MELIFHKSEKYIEEDIFYYTSDQRDKHSMIKPEKENLISMTIHSENLSAPDKNNIFSSLNLAIIEPCRAENWSFGSVLSVLPMKFHQL